MLNDRLQKMQNVVSLHLILNHVVRVGAHFSVSGVKPTVQCLRPPRELLPQGGFRAVWKCCRVMILNRMVQRGP